MAVKHKQHACPLQGAAASAGWQAVMAMPLFASPPGRDSATLMHLCKIFAARHVSLWRAPDALAWLLRCAEVSAALADDPAASQDAVHASVPPFEDMQAMTAMTYPPGDENAFQDVSLDQFSESTAVQLPPEQLAGAGMGGAGDPAAQRAHIEAIVAGLTASAGAVRTHSPWKPARRRCASLFQVAVHLSGTREQGRFRGIRLLN